MSTPIRIAFGHKKGVGKSYACTRLQLYHGGVTLNFADPLYEIMYHIQDTIGVARHKDRSLLRLIGTWGRTQDENMWVNILRRRVLELVAVNPNVNIFVGDLRFVNEATMLLELGFSLVKIVRPIIVSSEDAHESETALDNYEGWKVILNNNSSLDLFHDHLEKVVRIVTR